MQIIVHHLGRPIKIGAQEKTKIVCLIFIYNSFFLSCRKSVWNISALSFWFSKHVFRKTFLICQLYFLLGRYISELVVQASRYVSTPPMGQPLHNDRIGLNKKLATQERVSLLILPVSKYFRTGRWRIRKFRERAKKSKWGSLILRIFKLCSTFVQINIAREEWWVYRDSRLWINCWCFLAQELQCDNKTLEGKLATSTLRDALVSRNLTTEHFICFGRSLCSSFRRPAIYSRDLAFSGTVSLQLKVNRTKYGRRIIGAIAPAFGWLQLAFIVYALERNPCWDKANCSL